MALRAISKVAAWRALAVACGLGLLAAGGILLVVWRVRSADRPSWLGNQPENLRRAAEADPNDLTFYVLGDCRPGSPVTGRLLELADAAHPDFLVMLGDYARDYDHANHQFFVAKMADEDLSMPVLLTPGNHDINPHGPFTVEDFRAAYGADEAHFFIGRSLFLIVNDAPPYCEDLRFLDRLAGVLEANAPRADRIFLFMHMPPQKIDGIHHEGVLPGCDRFLALMDRHDVDYVFCGDHHSFWKSRQEGTNYVISGGGGARLRGEKGRFHHIVRVDVRDGQVTDAAIAVRPRSNGLNNFERDIVCKFWPALVGSRGGVLAAVSALLAMMGGLALGLRNMLRLQSRPADRRPRTARVSAVLPRTTGADGEAIGEPLGL
jgi:hypothetical protein